MLQVPTGRLFHAAAVIGEAMYIFGGTGDNNVRSSETYRFQFSSYPKCTLHDDFGKLLKTRQFCDIEFLVGQPEKRIKAHTSMVAARSQSLRMRIKEALESRQKHLEETYGNNVINPKDLPLLEVSIHLL